MRIIHTADWHIGKHLNDYSLLEDQQYWLERFVERLAELHPDALIIAGDLYDRPIPPGDAVSLLDRILAKIVLKLKIKTLIISGNHDSGERLSFGSGLLEKSGLYIAGRPERTTKKVTLTANGTRVNFYLLPYLDPYHIKSLYPEENVKTQEDAVRLASAQMLKDLDSTALNILAAHGFFSLAEERTEEPESSLPDISVGGSEIVSASLFSPFDYVALGHLHSQRSAGGERMLYSGSPLKYSIDEVNQKKGFLIVDIDGKNSIRIQKEAIPPLRELRVLEGSFEWLSARENHSSLNDYIFANLTDGSMIPDALSRLKAVFPNLLGLRYVNMKFTAQRNSDEKQRELRRLSADELFACFYLDVTGEKLSEEQKELADSAFAFVKAQAKQEGSGLSDDTGSA